MKALIHMLFGEGKDLNALQMTDRALLVFFLAIVLLRIAGRRAFGMKMPVDNVITILLGAILSRAVTGASPFLPTLAASLLLCLLHRLCAWACLKSKTIERLLKGNTRLLYKDGKFIAENLKHGMISESDLLEELHTRANIAGAADMESAWLERNGEIGIVKKKKE